MESATPQALAAEAEALWPRWAAHLAALAAGAQPAAPAGSGAGARLVRVLEALWQDRGEAAATAADSLWARELGREEGGLLASVASVSAMLAAFRARPDHCPELAAATHLAILRCAILLPGSGTAQWLGSGTPTRKALEQLCFKACPQALLGALGTAAGQGIPQSGPIILQADPSLPHQALLLADALSSWRHQQSASPGLTSLLEELQLVRGWVQVLDVLDQAGPLLGPAREMHETLVYVCSRALAAAATEKPRQARVMKFLADGPRLLRWYIEDLLRSFRDETLSAQGGRQVPLLACVEAEQLEPLLWALLSLLCTQRKAVAWLQGPGRSQLAAPTAVAKGLGVNMETSIYGAAAASLTLLEHLFRSPGSGAEVGKGVTAGRWRVAVGHIALPAALVAHALPGDPCRRSEQGKLNTPPGLVLAWLLEGILDSTGSGQWQSVHAWAAWLMRANLQSVGVLTSRTVGEASEALLSLLDCIRVESAPTAAVLTALGSGLFSQLAGWAIQVTRLPTNLLEPHVAQALQRLEQLLCMACQAADSLLLLPGEQARFAAANERLSAQAQDALDTVSDRQLQSRGQLGAHGIGAAVRGAWEQRRDQLLPPMERGARCGSAFVVGWQTAGKAASSGGSEAAAAAAAAAPCHSCPLPAVQQALALARVVCANPLCTRLGSTNGGGAGSALEQLQRCRGCRVASYCRREDWERHRPTCNAPRHLRHSTASMRPAVGMASREAAHG